MIIMIILFIIRHLKSENNCPKDKSLSEQLSYGQRVIIASVRRIAGSETGCPTDAQSLKPAVLWTI